MNIEMQNARDKIIDEIIDLEGGYVDDPHDLGRETNWGITKQTSEQAQYRPLWEKYGWDGDMKTLSRKMAHEMYIIGWWNKMMCDAIYEVSPNLAERMMDFGINAGRGNAVKSLQRILNVMNKRGTLWGNIAVDGGMGPNTFRTLINYFDLDYDKSGDKMTMLMFSMQNYHYVDISEKRDDERNEKFTQGWINRVWHQFINYKVARSKK